MPSLFFRGFAGGSVSCGRVSFYFKFNGCPWGRMATHQDLPACRVYFELVVECVYAKS